MSPVRKWYPNPFSQGPRYYRILKDSHVIHVDRNDSLILRARMSEAQRVPSLRSSEKTVTLVHITHIINKFHQSTHAAAG